MRLKVGISSCLMGDEVRFDGGHKRSAFATDELTRHIDLVRFCPEVGIGMPVPRPTIRLEKHANDSSETVEAVVPKTGEIVTTKLSEFADKIQIKAKDLSGYILCAKSPSCGMERVKLYDPETGHARKEATGIFASRLRENNPAMPLEEDGRLNDPHLRENFIMRVYLYGQWKQIEDTPTKNNLLSFHSSCKLLLLAHNQQRYRELGKRLGEADTVDAEFATQYIRDVMEALSEPASRRNHTNVLQHIQGYFKGDLEHQQREELSDIILQYHDGILPLMSPLTLIKHYLREFPKAYLDNQWYLNPYPVDLKLRYGL